MLASAPASPVSWREWRVQASAQARATRVQGLPLSPALVPSTQEGFSTPGPGCTLYLGRLGGLQSWRTLMALLGVFLPPAAPAGHPTRAWGWGSHKRYALKK